MQVDFKTGLHGPAVDAAVPCLTARPCRSEREPTHSVTLNTRTVSLHYCVFDLCPDTQHFDVEKSFLHSGRSYRENVQVTFNLKPQLSALAAVDAASAAASSRTAINSPAVLTCGEPAGSHPAGASQCGALCPAGPLIDVRIAAWIRDPSRSDVRFCARAENISFSSARPLA